jgi:hypothetical protein
MGGGLWVIGSWGDQVIGRATGDAIPHHRERSEPSPDHHERCESLPRHTKTLVDVDDRLDIAIRLVEDARIVA